MNLFNTLLIPQNIDLNPLTYSTQFGGINFDLTINKKEIKNLKPIKTIIFQNTIISSWEMENCHIEFLQTHFKPRIPPHMEVDTCLAGIWRMACFSKTPQPIFKVTLHPSSYLESHAVLESGEGLVAVTFENSEMQLSIGTEDEDYLNQRARAERWMPQHFSENIFSNVIQPIQNGIKVALPCLKEQDQVQNQFIVASSSKMHPKDSCWFAVEQSSEYILKEAGIV